MRPLVLLGLFFVLLPVVWSRLAPPIVYMETWPDGAVKVRAVSKRTADGDYIFHGPYLATHANGRPERQGEMRDGKEEGGWTWWFENGAKQAEGTFRRGSGDYTSYHENGHVHWQGHFRDGLRDGIWTEFSAQGRKLREGPYRLDLPHGDWTYWHQDDPDRTLVVRWQDGQPLEEGEPARSAAVSSAALSPWRHGLQVLAWWLLLLGPVPLCLTLAGAAKANLPVGHRVLVAGTTWIALQIVVGLALGLLHALRAPAVLATEAALLAAGWWASRRVEPWWQAWRLPHGGAARAMAFSWLVASLVLAWWMVSMPTDNFDSLAYHLPVVARWFQEGSLVRPSELGQVAFYPFHWEILSVLQIFPFGEDLAVSVPSLLAWILLGVAVHVLARDLGADRAGAWFATLTVSTLPVTLARVSAVQPDLALAAAFVGTLHLGRVAIRHAGWIHLLAWALAMGVLLGLKGSAVVYALVTVAFAGIERWLHREDAPYAAPPWKAVVVALLVVSLLGGAWYLRNWMQTGNPLGFVQVKLAGITLWPGAVDAASLRQGTLLTLFDPGRVEHWRLLGGMVRAELALPFGAMVLGAIGLTRPAVRQRLGSRKVGLVAVWILTATFVYWITPYSADNGAEGWRLTPRIEAGLRFGFPALAALAVGAGLGVTAAPRLSIALAAVAALSTVLGLLQRVEPGWQVLACAVGVGWLAFAATPRLTRRSWAFAAMVAVSVALLWPARQARDQWRGTLYGEAYQFVERTVPSGSVLGYALTQTRYPYYGRHLDRRLVSVVPARDSKAKWLDLLQESGVQWLLLGTTSSGEEATAAEPLVRDWVQADTDRFEQRFTYQSRRRDISVYRVMN